MCAWFHFYWSKFKLFSRPITYLMKTIHVVFLKLWIKIVLKIKYICIHTVIMQVYFHKFRMKRREMSVRKYVTRYILTIQRYSWERKKHIHALERHLLRESMQSAVLTVSEQKSQINVTYFQHRIYQCLIKLAFHRDLITLLLIQYYNDHHINIYGPTVWNVLLRGTELKENDDDFL